MKFRPHPICWLACIAGLIGLISSITVHAAIQPASPTRTSAPSAVLQKLPLSFEENRGQTNSQAKFIARAPGFTLFATPSEMITVMKSSTSTGDRAVVRTRLRGADRDAKLIGEGKHAAKSNYLVGNDPDKWTIGAAHFARIRQSNVYPGVDLVYHGDNSGLEYDFVVAPGADPKRIRLSFSGMQKIVIDPSGDLRLHTEYGELTQHKPIVYQTVDGERRFISGAFERVGKTLVGFRIGTYDHAKELVIDPAVEYATYFGGSSSDSAQAIAVDNNGNAYIVGNTNSSDLPVSSAVNGTNATNSSLMFVSKINTTTNTLVYSTYLGGANGANNAIGITVDASGSAYVVGISTATDFPLVGAIQATNSGTEDAVIAKLNSSGNTLLFSTYFGGSSSDTATAVAVGTGGVAYVVGYTLSANFPTKLAYQNSFGGFTDAFVAKIDTVAKSLIYSTYLGGNDVDASYAVTINSAGQAFVAGQTSSSNFQTTAGVLRASQDSSNEAFVTKFSADGQSLDFSTRLDDAYAAVRSIALNAAGNIFVAGTVSISCFAGAREINSNGFEHGFLATLDGTGASLTMNSCIRGAPIDGLALGPDGSMYVTGIANAAIVVGSGTSIQPFSRFFMKVLANGSGIGYGISLNDIGGANIFGGNRVAVDSSGHAYLTGANDGLGNIAVSIPNLGATVKGFEDAYLLRFAPTISTTTSLTGPSSNVQVGQPLQLTATVTNGVIGSVTFKNGNTILGTQALTGSTATLTTTTLPAGSNSVVALYDGDNTHDSSASQAVVVNVIFVKATPGVHLDMSSTDPDPGDTVTATVTVSGGNNPTGFVTFRVDGNEQNSVPLTSTGPTSGTASASFNPGGSGYASSNFDAIYSGDDNNERGGSNSIRVTTNSGIPGLGGGCTLGTRGRDMTLPIMLMLALLGVWRARKKAA